MMQDFTVVNVRWPAQKRTEMERTSIAGSDFWYDGRHKNVQTRVPEIVRNIAAGVMAGAKNVQTWGMTECMNGIQE